MKTLLLAAILVTHAPQWYMQLTSSNFPNPFNVAGGYSSQAQCEEAKPDVVDDWSAKTYSSGPKKGQNIFGAVAAECKQDAE